MTTCPQNDLGHSDRSATLYLLVRLTGLSGGLDALSRSPWVLPESVRRWAANQYTTGQLEQSNLVVTCRKRIYPSIL